MRTIYCIIGDDSDVDAWFEGSRFYVRYKTETGMHVHLKTPDLWTFRRALRTAERDERRVPLAVYDRISAELEAVR